MNRSINLYNPALRKREPLFSALQMVQGLLLVLVGTLVLYGYTTHIEEGLRLQEAEIERIASDGQAQSNRLATALAARTAKRNLPTDIQTLEQRLHDRRQLFSALSGELSHGHGYSQYLRAFARQNVDGLWLTAFSIDTRGVHLQIHGRALRAALIPHYLKRLGQEPALQGKHFAALEIQHSIGTTTTSTTDTTTTPDQQPIDFTLHSVEGDKPK